MASPQLWVWRARPPHTHHRVKHRHRHRPPLGLPPRGRDRWNGLRRTSGVVQAPVRLGLVASHRMPRALAACPWPGLAPARVHCAPLSASSVSRLWLLPIRSQVCLAVAGGPTAHRPAPWRRRACTPHPACPGPGSPPPLRVTGPPPPLLLPRRAPVCRPCPTHQTTTTTTTTLSAWAAIQIQRVEMNVDGLDWIRWTIARHRRGESAWARGWGRESLHPDDGDDDDARVASRPPSRSVRVSPPLPLSGRGRGIIMCVVRPLLLLFQQPAFLAACLHTTVVDVTPSSCAGGPAPTHPSFATHQTDNGAPNAAQRRRRARQRGPLGRPATWVHSVAHTFIMAAALHGALCGQRTGPRGRPARGPALWAGGVRASCYTLRGAVDGWHTAEGGRTRPVASSIAHRREGGTDSTSGLLLWHSDPHRSSDWTGYGLWVGKSQTTTTTTAAAQFPSGLHDESVRAASASRPPRGRDRRRRRHAHKWPVTRGPHRRDGWAAVPHTATTTTGAGGARPSV